MLPSQVSPDISFFDRFAAWASKQVARAPFFAFCVLMIVLWPVSFLFLDADTAQLIVNTATTIVTFLLVALLENSQHRADQALQHKLNGMADALADLMDAVKSGDVDQLDRDVDELRAAVGLEDRESSSGT